MLSRRQPTGSNKQLLPSLINFNVFSSSQTLYLENCPSINCLLRPGLAWHCVGRVEVFREIQALFPSLSLSLSQDNGKEGWRPVSVSGILISRNGSSPGFICCLRAPDVFKYCDGGGPWGRYWPLSWSEVTTVGRGDQGRPRCETVSLPVRWQPLTCQTIFYPSLRLPPTISELK